MMTVRPGPGGPAATVRTRSTSIARRRSPRADRPELRWTPSNRIPPGRSTSAKVLPVGRRCHRGSGRRRPTDDGDRASALGDRDRGAGRLREPLDDCRVRRLLEDRDIRIQALQHLCDRRPTRRAALADVVRRDPEAHDGEWRTTYGCRWTTARRSRNQPAMAWMLSGRRITRLCLSTDGIERRCHPRCVVREGQGVDSAEQARLRDPEVDGGLADDHDIEVAGSGAVAVERDLLIVSMTDDRAAAERDRGARRQPGLEACREARDLGRIAIECAGDRAGQHRRAIRSVGSRPAPRSPRLRGPRLSVRCRRSWPAGTPRAGGRWPPRAAPATWEGRRTRRDRWNRRGCRGRRSAQPAGDRVPPAGRPASARPTRRSRRPPTRPSRHRRGGYPTRREPTRAHPPALVRRPRARLPAGPSRARPRHHRPVRRQAGSSGRSR